MNETMNDINSLTVVYVDSRGFKHYQSAGDIVYMGTLIDPDTGEDMEMVGYVVEAGS